MPAPSDAFANLEDLLLRGGIAPKHVKRYLRELSEHLADLMAAQREAGFDAQHATARARAALGPDQDLADAMLKQRDFRSFSSRFPWAMFLLSPAPAILLAYCLWAVSLILIGKAAGAINPSAKHYHVTAWFAWMVANLMAAANFIIPPALAWLLVWVAQRQRLKLGWPLAAVALILSFGPRASMTAGSKNMMIGLTSTFPLPPKGPLGGPISIHWPTFLTQALLLSLPVLWLLWTRRKTAIAP